MTRSLVIAASQSIVAEAWNCGAVLMLNTVTIDMELLRAQPAAQPNSATQPSKVGLGTFLEFRTLLQAEMFVLQSQSLYRSYSYRSPGAH